ncbi:SDR family oxidoreductase [Brachybacterium sacelli]
MIITVLGARGTIGSRLADQLEERAHDVRRVSRRSGVDARTGVGLREALRGADVAVDCLNHMALRAATAEDFFRGTAQHVVRSARSEGVRRLVCVSIAGAADPAVNRLLGYYRGKAAQEQVYSTSREAVTIVRSTQWYELMDDVLRRASIGPVSVLPTMTVAALSADRAARHIADEIDASVEDLQDRTLTLRGPQTATIREIARTILAARGSIGGRRPRALVQLPYLGQGIAGGGLVPADGIVDDLTLEDWLAAGPSS